MEDKLTKLIGKIKEESFGKIITDLNDLKEKVQRNDDNAIEKIKNVKKTFSDFESQLPLKVLTLEKHDFYKKTSNDKFTEIDKKLNDLDKRGDANSILSQFKQMFKESEI